MATAQRKSTAQSRTRKAGAAPAVEDKKDLTVESDPVSVDQEIAVEDRRSLMEIAEEAADAADAENTEAETPENTPEESPVAVPAEDAKDPAVSTPVEHEDEDPVAPRDLNVLRSMADTSGQGTTPYSADGITAPTPAKDLPKIRGRYDWTVEGDTPMRGRVLVDGFRLRINGGHRFAQKGDIITAPSDIITKGVERGVLHLED